MRTVTFQSVLHGAARLAGITDPATELNAVRAADLTAYLNERFRAAWEHQWWSEWTLCERRRFAPDYSGGATYAAPTYRTADFVWHPGSQKYYQNLWGGISPVPATLSGTTWTTFTSWWADAEAEFGGLTDWQASTAYAVGDQVRRLDDGHPYQCVEAHTSSTSLDASKFKLLVPFVRRIQPDQVDNHYEATGVAETPIGQVKRLTRNDPRTHPNARPVASTPTSEGWRVLGTGAPDSVWVEFRRPADEFTTTAYSNTTDYVVGDTVYHATTGESYEATAATTGNAPTDTAYWRRLEFPAVLSGHVKLAVAADVLAEQKQGPATANLRRQSEEELHAAADRDREAQGQQDRMLVTGFA